MLTIKSRTSSDSGPDAFATPVDDWAVVAADSVTVDDIVNKLGKID